MKKHIRVENNNFVFHRISQRILIGASTPIDELRSKTKKPEHGASSHERSAFPSLEVFTKAGNQAAQRANNNPGRDNQGLLFDQKAMDCIASLIATQVRCDQSS